MDSTRTKLLAALAVLGVAIVIAVVDRGPLPGPRGPAAAGPMARETTAPSWAAQVEAGEDHLAPDEFARRLLDAPDTLAIVDVRPADEFAAFHVPGAVNLDLVRLLGPEGAAFLDANAAKTVVLVSDGMTHPAQAWVELARRGRTNVRILEDGLDGLKATAWMPPSLRGPTTERRVAEEGARARALAARLAGRKAPAAPRPARWATDPAALTAPTVVSTAWVAARLGQVAVLDTREKAEDVAKGRIPGAVHVPIAATRETRGGVADEMLPVEALAAKAGAWGLTADTEVVVYGGEKLQDPTHLLLVLVALGHARVAVMEGGFGAWTAEGRPVTKDAPTPTPATYVARPGAFDFGVTLDDVVAASRGGGPAIVDVRPTKAFEGEKGPEVRGGRIPTSRSRPYTEDVVVDGGGAWWRGPDELRAGYAGLGLASDGPVIVSCRTGHQASQAWFTLRYLLGYKDVRWFDGSWKAWSLRADLPAETGPVKKKEAP
ncbi:MAG: rhodanese-like domain-containing protein [Planctomycetota bacterium]